jgi:hypothetical protein
MRTATHIASAVLASLALSGCFAEVEDPSLTYTHRLPDDGQMFEGVQASPLELIVFNLRGGSTQFTVDLGDQDFLKPTQEAGPVTLESTLILNRATLTMSNESAGASFEGIDELRLHQLAEGTNCSAGPCVAPSCQEIATYDRARDGQADTEVTLRGSSLNMVELLQGGQLILCVVGRGTPPSVDWSADATLDMSIKAHASFP